ncbi:MAG: isoprenyl transferase [Hyphomicrobiales bacterium]
MNATPQNVTKHTESTAEVGDGFEVPRHIAIIMDGNGRWAAKRSLPRSAGHRQGVEAVRRAVRAALEMGVDYLTLFSFSSENWQRPADEVQYLMALLRRFVHQDVSELHAAGVKVCIIGNRDNLTDDLIKLIEDTEKLTANNAAMTVNVAFNYGSRDELVRAARSLAQQVANETLSPSDITEDAISGALDTAGIPDPDLVIRTSGEQRLSNFLMWQCAYAELVFLDEHWPDFEKEHLLRAIEVFNARERRFGDVTSRKAAPAR